VCHACVDDADLDKLSTLIQVRLCALTSFACYLFSPVPRPTSVICLPRSQKISASRFLDTQVKMTKISLLATALFALGALATPVELAERQRCNRMICPVGMVCVEPGYCTRPTNPCDIYPCLVGTTCMVVMGRPSCVRDPSFDECDLVDCIPDTQCVLIDGQANCLPLGTPTPCGTTTCPSGEDCCSSRCEFCAPRGQPFCLSC
jgi:hypothetical protein